MFSLFVNSNIAVYIAFLFFTSCTFFLPETSIGSNEGTVAFVMKALSNPFFSKMEEGASKYAQDHKITLEIFGVDRETDIDHQISIVENLISRGYSAIILAPTDSKRLVPVCKKALEKGIVVINVDNPLHKPTMDRYDISVPFIGPDNFVGGQMIGNYIKNKLQGKGRILVLEGIRGAENGDLRKAGFTEAVKKKSSIEIVSSQSAEWHTAEALSITLNLLKEHKLIDAIFCANDAMALGALQAIDLLGISRKILLAGYDNIESVRTEMRSGRIHATIEQHPEIIGKLGVESAWNRLNGITVPTYNETPLDLITYEHFGKKITFFISSLQNAFFSVMAQGAEEMAELFGFELTVQDADNQDARQLTDIAGVLSQGIDLLILNPVNTSSIYPGIELANKKEVPVITVDRKVSEEEVLCHIESDNIEGGRMAAKFMFQRLKKNGTLLELEGIPGTSAAYERGAGFNEELGRYDNIDVTHREVANFDRLEARDVTRRILAQKVSLDGVFAHNDNMILGLIDVFEELNRELPEVLIGFDAIPEARKAVKNHKLTATIAQQPRKMGKLAVITAARYFRGEEIAPKIFVELSLIVN